MKNKKIFDRYTWLLVILVVVAVVSTCMVAHAASMTYARDYLNRNAAGLTTGLTHEIVFTPATNVSGGAGTNKVILVFPDADDGRWCATAGADLVASTAPTLHDTAIGLPGATKTGACVKGVGGSSYDTITVNGVDNLIAGTMYAVKLSDGSTGKMGTPAGAESAVVTVKTNNGSTDVDTKNITLAILGVGGDQISVTGTVDPIFTLGIGTTAVGFGSITSGAIRYATTDLLGASSVPAAGSPIQITTSTNAQSGVSIEFKDTNAVSATGMYMGSPATTLTSTISSNIAAGTAAFGAYAKNSSNLTIDTKFDNNAAGDGAITAAFQSLATASGPIASGSIDLVLMAAISAATPPGSYADTLTVVGTGKF
jgi:hypothetical protein